MQGKQITAGQLTCLWAKTNVNYAAKEWKRLKSMGSTPRKVDRNPSTSTTNHPS